VVQFEVALKGAISEAAETTRKCLGYRERAALQRRVKLTKSMRALAPSRFVATASFSAACSTAAYVSQN
jgi:hypothetical protein